MKQSWLFAKTRREAPKDETSLNARLLIRAGFIHKEMAGVYAYLPLGLRVLNKIEQIIREEMDAIGGQEVKLTALQDPALWEKTGRWSNKVLDIWFKTKLAAGGETGLATTHEEPLTEIMSHHISSYRDLPQYVYQFQTKFRNELRAKSGILRGREFLMKDLYSFNRDQKSLEKFYEKAKQAYFNIFKKVGLGDVTYLTFASGGAFSKFSHEFQTVCEVGEDTIYLDKSKRIAVNREVYTDEILRDLKLNKKDLVEKRSIEVGNIFKLGTRFSKPLKLTFVDEDGAEKFVVMGSYGIGLGRLMGTVVELFNDKDGIIWPESIAPFKYHILCDNNHKEAVKQSDKLYDKLLSEGQEVLLDDRQETLPAKIKDADLIGCPVRIIVSEKSLRRGGVEVKKRPQKKARILSLDALEDLLS